MPISRAIYRALLLLCPADLRRQFGREMEALFLADLKQARGAGDPVTMIGVAAALLLVALVAVTVPALRAMRIDPVTALRE